MKTRTNVQLRVLGERGEGPAGWGWVGLVLTPGGVTALRAPWDPSLCSIIAPPINISGFTNIWGQTGSKLRLGYKPPAPTPSRQNVSDPQKKKRQSQPTAQGIEGCGHTEGTSSVMSTGGLRRGGGWAVVAASDVSQGGRGNKERRKGPSSNPPPSRARPFHPNSSKYIY